MKNKSFYRNIFIFLLLMCANPQRILADEGMWLPMLLGEQKYDEMTRMGLKLTPEQIYSANEACITNAVIGLMGEGSNYKSFCTASFVSAEGLIITNNHCVMNYIERISTSENDFLKYGYWASKPEEETHCYGLMAKQLVRIEDVTDEILSGTQGLTGEELQKQMNANGKKIADRLTKGTEYESHIQQLMAGNQYIISVYRVFKDVRIVAAPPVSLGKFGGNTDNWRWPRHTADFTFMRIYADGDNRPAKYEKTNVPFRPAYFIPVSAKGVSEEDFAMVLGFPSSSKQYVPSFGVEKIIYSENKAGIVIAGEKLRILEQAIEENPELKFRYFSRMSSLGNKYLRMKGEYSGVEKMQLVEAKKAEEEEFKRWVAADPARTAKYGGILERMDSLYGKLSVYNLANNYFLDAGITGSEVTPFIGKFEKLVAMFGRKNINRTAIAKESEKLIPLTRQFFNNWDYEIDRKFYRNVLFRYWEDMPPAFIPDIMTELVQQYNGDIEQLTRSLFENSIFSDEDKLIAFLESDKEDGISVITDDPLYKLSIGYYKVNVVDIARQRGALQAQQLRMYKIYLEGLMEMNAGRPFSPDANSSFRVSYGRVGGCVPEDGLYYEYRTTLSGMVDKSRVNPDSEEFHLPLKLRRLFDEGASDGVLKHEWNPTVCFLTDCHTSSGNSGSPVLNGEGHLVGLNFDRIYQGVASDFRYDKDVSRNISVSTDFILYTLDLYSPNNYVLDQLTIVR